MHLRVDLLSTDPCEARISLLAHRTPLARVTRQISPPATVLAARR